MFVFKTSEVTGDNWRGVPTNPEVQIHSGIFLESGFCACAVTSDREQAPSASPKVLAACAHAL